MDYNATTPVDPRVLEVMLPCFREVFGNAASSHSVGLRASRAVERARDLVAHLIGADPREIVFTCGATESNNLAIKGVAQTYRDKGRHIITAAHEHKGVVDPCKRLMDQGFAVTWLRPSPASAGVITADQVAEAIRDDTILVTIMWANNEIGTLNDAPAIGRLCRQRGVIFHTDATQYVGKLPCDVNDAGIDLLSASAHKIYGPKGAGFLYVRRKGPRVRLAPLFDGGGHERGMRSGTLNVPGIVGLGAAAEIYRHEWEGEANRLRAMRDRFEAAVLQRVDRVSVNGCPDRRLPGTSNLGFGGAQSDALMKAMPGVAISAGSACSSANLEPSYVLKALGLPDDVAQGSVRFSLGRFTTDAQVDQVVDMVAAAVPIVREGAQACGQTDASCDTEPAPADAAATRSSDKLNR